jgi:hypothetical protein
MILFCNNRFGYSQIGYKTVEENQIRGRKDEMKHRYWSGFHLEGVDK